MSNDFREGGSTTRPLDRKAKNSLLFLHVIIISFIATYKYGHEKVTCDCHYSIVFFLRSDTNLMAKILISMSNNDTMLNLEAIGCDTLKHIRVSTLFIHSLLYARNVQSRFSADTGVRREVWQK